MLEGLEISEVMLNELERTIRFDAEFYSEDNLKTSIFLRKKKHTLLTDCVSVSDGNHMSISEKFCSEGVPYYRGQDVHNFFIEQSNPIYIDESTFLEPIMKRSHLQRGDLLLSIVGTVGKLSLVFTDRKQTCSCKLAILRPKISAEFLSIFLSSKFGQKQIKKLTRGAVQMGLILEDMDQVIIPTLLEDFQIHIKDMVLESYVKLEQSKSLYAQAEALLLKSLGLENFSPSSKNTNIKSFKDSFATTSRLDAEYYQPKYEDYQNHVFSYQEGWSPLEKVCDLKDKNYSPNDEKFYQYIELADINKSGGITGCSKELGKDLPSRARRKVNAGDVLISSIEGSLSSCAIVGKEFENSLCSTGFYVIKSDKINSETLLVLFKSDLMQNILKQSCSGTILTAINKDEFLKFPLPLINPKTQSQISLLIQESFALKSKSEKLLELAKQAVEMVHRTPNF